MVMPSVAETLGTDLHNARTQVVALRTRIFEGAIVAHDEAATLQSLHEIDAAEEELRVAEEELQARADELAAMHAAFDLERQRYRHLFDMAPEAYLVTDLRGNVLEANRRCGVLLNVDPKRVVGKPMVHFVALQDRERLDQLLHRLDGRPYRGELRVQPRRSDPIAVSVSARRVAGQNGEDPGIWWLLRLEQPRAADAAQLEALRAQLEQKNRILTEVAHELRAPLGSVAGWLRILTQDALEREVRERALLGATRGVRALMHLIEELDDHARLEVHKVELARALLDVRRLVLGVVDDLRPFAQLKSMRIEMTGEPQALEVVGDASRLAQVFRNVIGNAIKFSSPGGRIDVAGGAVDGHAEITVSDTGAGIATGDLRSIFEPFAQAANAKRGCERGLGLGLSIAQRFVAMHGGTIEASSEGLDRGATFRVRLPLAVRR